MKLQESALAHSIAVIVKITNLGETPEGLAEPENPPTPQPM
ncbi:Uncharacterised protein [Staphylococcus intermedius NCTC 11048]|uniref:Uncharacterized protein n=1 Tax=Staphylococcus intermedius NCTC 11048 TaxID=1141106 RepID=A0A380GBG5_STAIN|nr:Uncharacterised protein [Staphylococcus intermedius NCTC 11048]